MPAETREHPYAPWIGRVRKPARYLGGESGERRKDWGAARCRMCLAFPDLYEVGMSHLGYKILYGILNGHPDLLAERAYAPWEDMERELRARGEKLRSLETWHALDEFDVVGFSLQFELTYTNVLLMLDLGGIPLRSADRTDGHPLVIAGGPVATHAEPLAPFVDAFLIGDGEERTPELMLRWAELRDAGAPRAERLRRLAELEGIYVPALYETEEDPDTGFHVVSRALVPEARLPVDRTFVEDLNRHPFPADGPVAATETVFDRVSVEIARGCTEGCRFCQAGMIYRPVRERDPRSILDTVEKAVRGGGYDEASFTSLSTADYSAISPLVREAMARLERERVALSVSSLRAYGLGEDVLDEMKKGRATGLTFAPEAGTQRMRDVVNKNVTEEQLVETAERVFSRGWTRMKLYFMIGLPTEEEEDVRGIVQTGARALEVGRRIQGNKTPRVTVSVSIHVPKPHTPFQWCAMDDHDTVVRKQQILREEARRTGVKLRMHDSRGSWLEGVLARGDRRLADVIQRAYEGGARFDSWEERLKLDVWEDAFERSGIDPAPFLRTIPVTARLPWDHLDVGLEKGFLVREYRKALRNRLSPPCGKAAGMFVHHTNVADAEADPRRLVCYDCGIACDLSDMRQERLAYLRGLGANEPLAPRSEEERTRITTPEERRPQYRVDRGTAIRVRLAFTRLGRVAFQSHLDMVRLLPRIFRRAELPLYYSEGFHPKPVMTFGPSLPVGIASLCEHVDLKLREDLLGEIDPDAFVDRLNGASFDGIVFTGARVLGPHDAGLSKVVDERVYVAGLARDALASLGVADVEGLRARVEKRRHGDLRVRRQVDGIGKTVDVGAYLLDARVGEGGALLARAGLVGDLVPIAIRIRHTRSGTARATEVLEALLGTPEVSARLVRVALYGSPAGERAAPLDLERLRRGPTRPEDTGAVASA